MKLLNSKLWALAITFAATLSIVGCDKPNNTPPDEPNPDPVNAVVLPKAQAIFIGDEYEKGNAHFMFVAHSDGLAFDKVKQTFTGSGECIWIDFISVMPNVPKNPYIADGTYTVYDFETELKEFAINGGVDGGSDQPSGSHYAKVVDGKQNVDLIIGGKMYVTRAGDAYKVVMIMNTASGKELVYKYENKLDIMIVGAPIPPNPFAGTFTTGMYMYFDNFYEVNYGNAMIELTDIPTDGSSKAGHILGLDVNTALITSQKDMSLKAGEYKIDKSKTFNTPMTFNSGEWTEGQAIFGSYWVDLNTDGANEEVFTVNGGSFTVTDLGEGKFKIVAKVTLEDGSTREGTYEGSIRFVDESCLSRLVDGNIDLTNFTQGMMVYRGIDIEYFANNSANWAVVLATEGIDLTKMTGQGDAVLLDINTPRENKLDIPVGDFLKIVKFNSTALLPMTYIPGYFATDRQRPAGTWYMKDMEYAAPATSGTIKIAKDGSKNYTISFQFRDDYHYVTNGNKIDGSYTGELSYLDATADKAKEINNLFAAPKAPFAIQPVNVKGQKPQYKIGQKSHSASYEVAR